jgi:hypothetical protein
VKKIIILIAFSVLLIACSKKTHVLDSYKVSKQTKRSNDSTGQKKTETINRSIIITYRDIDTNIITTGNILTGYINPLSSNSTDTIIDAHFENNDISLDLQTDKKSGLTKAIARTKPQNIPVRIHEKTTIHNDIRTIEDIKSTLKTKIETKTDSIGKHVTDHTDPNTVVKGLRSLVIWFLVIVVIVGIALYLVKKFSFISLISRWIKRLI